jgi:hypothetical protein
MVWLYWLQDRDSMPNWYTINHPTTLHTYNHQKYWELAELENEVFWVGHFDFFFGFISMKTSSPFIWGIIYFCTMDGFFRILEKISSELICTRLYLLNILMRQMAIFVDFMIITRHNDMTLNLMLRGCTSKVHIFWESHKILQNLHPRRFDCYYTGQI